MLSWSEAGSRRGITVEVVGQPGYALRLLRLIPRVLVGLANMASFIILINTGLLANTGLERHDLCLTVNFCFSDRI